MIIDIVLDEMFFFVLQRQRVDFIFLVFNVETQSDSCHFCLFFFVFWFFVLFCLFFVFFVFLYFCEFNCFLICFGLFFLTLFLITTHVLFDVFSNFKFFVCTSLYWKLLLNDNTVILLMILFESCYIFVKYM